MRQLVINAFVTLDGVMQAPGGADEDPTGGFTHGGWSVRYWDDTMVRRIGESMARPFALLLGRRTYEIFAAHWPELRDDPIADALNGAVKYVASRTLDRVDWNNARLLNGDVPQAVSHLKQEDGPEIQVHGSARLIQTLLKHDLIDEFRLLIFPLVLGSGKRLFDDGTIPGGLELVDSATSATGVLMAIFRRGGAITHSAMAESLAMSRFTLEQPTDAELSRREKLANESPG